MEEKLRPDFGMELLGRICLARKDRGASIRTAREIGANRKIRRETRRYLTDSNFSRDPTRGRHLSRLSNLLREIFFCSTTQATNIELRKAITDNGPGGTQRRDCAKDLGVEKGSKAELQRIEKKRKAYPRKIRMYRVVIKQLQLSFLSVLLMSLSRS